MLWSSIKRVSVFFLFSVGLLMRHESVSIVVIWCVVLFVFSSLLFLFWFRRFYVCGSFPLTFRFQLWKFKYFFFANIAVIYISLSWLKINNFFFLLFRKYKRVQWRVFFSRKRWNDDSSRNLEVVCATNYEQSSGFEKKEKRHLRTNPFVVKKLS